MITEDVAKQSHYTKHDIEPIDYIRNLMTDEELRGYYWGNVIKYISRWKEKGGVQDLEKARVYLNWWIEHENKPKPTMTTAGYPLNITTTTNTLGPHCQNCGAEMKMRWGLSSGWHECPDCGWNKSKG